MLPRFAPGPLIIGEVSCFLAAWLLVVVAALDGDVSVRDQVVLGTLAIVTIVVSLVVPLSVVRATRRRELVTSTAQRSERP